MKTEELQKLSDTLKSIELNLKNSYGLHKVSGGFVYAEMESYDNKFIYLKVKSGTQNDVNNDFITENLTLDRESLEVIN